MAVEVVKEYFKQFNMQDRIKEYEVSSATVELAAKAAGTTPQRIAKTLSFKTEQGCLLVVCSGDKKIDNTKFKQEFGRKANMLKPEEVKIMVGHEIGGVCPFGIPKQVEVFLDKSLQPFPTVFVACGSSNSVIELSCEELEKYSNSIKWIDVCKDN